MGRIERQREIARKRTRKAKLKKLKTRYAGAKSEAEKAVALQKIQRISPFATVE